MRPKSFHFLYRTTCTLNGKFYIGIHSTDNLDDGYLGSGKHVNASINKYGRDQFFREILCFGTRDYVKDLEIAYVDENLISNPQCMNHALGGQGGRGPSLCRTKESYVQSGAKISKKLKGRTKENDETVKNRAKKLLGRSKDTHEGYKKISELKKSQTGEMSIRSKLTDLQREEIYSMWLQKITPQVIQNIILS